MRFLPSLLATYIFSSARLMKAVIFCPEIYCATPMLTVTRKFFSWLMEKTLLSNSKSIIVLFEIIEIQNQQSQWMAVTIGSFNLSFYSVKKMP